MSRSASLLIASGAAQETLIGHVFDVDWGGRTVPILVAAARRELLDQPDGEAWRVATKLMHRGFSVAMIAPCPLGITSLVRRKPSIWATVPVGARASRLSEVWLPAELAHAAHVVAVNTISLDANEPVAIGMWARFARPKQRIGALLSDKRDGLTAEIALAVAPSLILLFGTWRAAPLLIASDDQVAAEVAGIALRQLIHPDTPSIGPWEDRLVQHATELEVGAVLPSQIEPEVVWLGDSNGPDESAFRDLASALLRRIGVESSG